MAEKHNDGYDQFDKFLTEQKNKAANRAAVITSIEFANNAMSTAIDFLTNKKMKADYEEEIFAIKAKIRDLLTKMYRENQENLFRFG